MTAQCKIAANRRNSRNSRGPVSAAGKKIASRNALRHGLSAVTHYPHAPSSDINRIGKALRDGDSDPALIEAALKIAENEMALRAVRQQKLAAVERLRDVTAIALVKGDNSLAVAQAKLMQFWLINRELETFVPKLMEKYKDEMPPSLEHTSTENKELPWLEYADDIVPIRLKALLEPKGSNNERACDSNRSEVELEERDEHESLIEALADLVKLDRYERRASSRQLRAFYAFMNVKVMQRFNEARRAKAQGS